MNYSTRRSVQHQRRRLAHYAQSCDSFSYFNLLTSDALLEEVEAHLPDHRERRYPPTETLSMFLAQAMSSDRSCQNIVNQAAVDRVVGGLPKVSTRTGGYCRARKRLPTPMVRTLTRKLGRSTDASSSTKDRWNGRRVYLVDGTSVTMADTPENQASFPQQGGQKPGLGFPICRVVGITSLATGALLDAAIGRFNGKGGDEQTLLRQLTHTLKSGDVVIGDAFFPTWFFILEMQAKGVDIVMEQQGARKRVTDFRKGTKLGTRDHLITLPKPKIKPDWLTQREYDKAPESLIVREFKAGCKIMVTTMSCPQSAPKSELKKLYKLRWNVELDLRDIKQTLGMNILSCKSPEMVIKEIWVYLLAYNLIRLLMLQSALLADIPVRSLSFKHSLQIWLAITQKAMIYSEEQLNALLTIIAEQQVGKRPGRVEPRSIKRRPKAYPLLMVPRNRARQSILEHGHAAKLK